VIGGPTPNPLPSGLFAESPLQFNLAMTAGFGPGSSVDPVVAAQQFNFFIIGDYWSVQAQFDYAPNTGIFHSSDMVTMTGDAVHPHPGEFARPRRSVQRGAQCRSVLTLPPDLDISPGGLRQFIRQANLPVGARFGADFRSVVHDPGPHEEVILLALGPTWVHVSFPLQILCLYMAFNACQMLVSHVLLWTSHFRANMWLNILPLVLLPTGFDNRPPLGRGRRGVGLGHRIPDQRVPLGMSHGPDPGYAAPGLHQRAPARGRVLRRHGGRGGADPSGPAG
jgi:hypothetical protein